MSKGFLLDTNVPSELTRPAPDQRVSAWIQPYTNDLLWLSVISAGELRKGIRLLAPGRRRTHLEEWLDNALLPLFDSRLIPVTQAIAERWGLLTATRQLKGAPLGMADGLIAATALEHDLTLVARNVKDFADLDLDMLNPWE